MAREERDQQRRAFGAQSADETWIEASESGTARAAPLPDGAHRRLSRSQWIGLFILPVVLAVLLALRPHATWESLHLLFFVGFMSQSAIKLGAAFMPRAPTPPPSLADDALPAYTVIVPLYREAEVAAELVANLSRLDYPRDRLQVLITLEAKDHETQAAFGALDLPAGFQVLVAPPGSPQTKPRACNIALERARGDLVVIYDAEDAPHPGQLREAAARFAQADTDLACLQAPLRIEPDPRFLPDQFALEYAVLFEVFLPALARWGLPFPLGGTSNHFRGIM
jgi:cellulose synthase/poly-beta-1,6-N-acetylglucosamine synthase-like glycosyltransferase